MPLTFICQFHRYSSIVFSLSSKYRKGDSEKQKVCNFHGVFICILGHKLNPVLHLQVCISIHQGVEVNSPVLVLKRCIQMFELTSFSPIFILFIAVINI